MSKKEEMVDVSIIVLSYCHEKYIAQALESILNQETDLYYEVLVGDDASGDRTPEIIREYAGRYPNIIKPVLRELQQLGLDSPYKRKISCNTGRRRFLGG